MAVTHRTPCPPRPHQQDVQQLQRRALPPESPRTSDARSPTALIVPPQPAAPSGRGRFAKPHTLEPLHEVLELHEVERAVAGLVELFDDGLRLRGVPLEPDIGQRLLELLVGIGVRVRVSVKLRPRLSVRASFLSALASMSPLPSLSTSMKLSRTWSVGARVREGLGLGLGLANPRP